MDKVIAVVVTYNRQQLLSECITALKNQTRKLDQILIINNGSTDGTLEWLSKQKNLQYITQDDVGSAGGFHTGIHKAYADNYHWVWLMDDDGYPKENALEKLLEGDPEELCLRNSIVVDKKDRNSLVWKTGKFTEHSQVDTRLIMDYVHPFNGTLIHRKIIERAGLPNPKLFLWGDESEYLYRIIKLNRIPCCTVTDSIHYHPATSFSYTNDWNFASGWKMYYYVRNRYYILISKFCRAKVIAFPLYVGFLFMFAFSIILFQKTNKLRKLNMILWPARDAMKANFTATPETILEKLKCHYSGPMFSLKHYIHNVFGLFYTGRTHASVSK